MPPLQEQSKEKSPWAMIIILIVILTFGFFWLWQQQSDKNNRIEVTPVATTPVTPAENQAPVGDLEASVVNISIPNFGEAF